LKILHVEGNENYNDNGTASSAALSASMSTRCGASSGCEGGDGHQILSGAGNILNKQERRFDNGCPPVSLLGVFLTSQQFESLLRYGILHKASD
jgi:hypothetical protein